MTSQLYIAPDAPELLPCPFCGAVPELESTQERTYAHARVVCRDCGGHMYCGIAQDVTELIHTVTRRWNARTPLLAAGGTRDEQSEPA